MKSLIEVKYVVIIFEALTAIQLVSSAFTIYGPVV